MIPKISLNDMMEICEHLLDLGSIEKFVNMLRKEQPDIYFNVIFNGLENPSALMGFIIAYAVIKKALEKKEIAELEKLVK